MLLAEDKQNMILKIKENQHEIYILSMSQFDATINSSPAARQKSWMKQDWVELNTKVKKVTNYSGSVKDIETIGKLIWELGGVKTKVQVKSYGGKPHIILKGNPSLRNILTGTKYGIQKLSP